MTAIEAANVSGVIDRLREVLKTERRIVTIEVADDATLEAFERELGAALQAKMEAEAMVRYRPSSFGGPSRDCGRSKSTAGA